jgi:peptidoglycan/LPS O-acetylase OafA/YrhL
MTIVRAKFSTQNERLGYLDALRGFAAMYVVVHHVGLMPKYALPIPDWLKAIVGFGGSGVTLFFIISGFSMCLSWNRHARASSPVMSFYINRLARIAPLFYFWLLLALIRDFIFKGSEAQHGALEISANVLFLFNLYEPFQKGIVWASWTIGVEMLFYGLFPFIKRAGLDNLIKTTLIMVLSLILVILAQSDKVDQSEFSGRLLQTLFDGVGFFHVLPIFLMGVVTYHVHVALSSFRSNMLRLWLGRLFLITSIISLSILAINNPTGLIAYYSTALAYSLLLLGLAPLSVKIIVNPFTTYIGKISYSLYLNHPTLVYILIPFYLVIFNFSFEPILALLVCVFVTLSILVPISHLTFWFIESPMMEWSKRRSRQPL